MHTDRVLEVAAAIRKAPPEAFDMRFYYDYAGRWTEDGTPVEGFEADANKDIVKGGLGSCGTAGCIAGWAVSIFHEEAHEILDADVTIGDDWEYLGMEILGLTVSQAHDLFMGNWFHGPMAAITNINAADYLEWLVQNPDQA
jgi:hypothetical protein